MLPGVTLALAVITGLVAVVDWWAAATRTARVEVIAKPLTMVGLVAVALAAGAADHDAGRWLLVALLFGLLGDIMLLGHTPRRFLGGVAMFLVGHLAYAACLVRLGLPHPGWSWLCLVVLAGMLIVTRDVVPASYRLAGTAVAGPVAAYSLVIGAMLVLAWLTGVALIALGATIFVVSDSIIGLNLARKGFGGPSGSAQVVVMITYHLGQALITAGVLHQL